MWRSHTVTTEEHIVILSDDNIIGLQLKSYQNQGHPEIMEKHATLHTVLDS